MKTNKLILAKEQFGSKFILAGIIPAKEYIDGKPTGKVKGYKYTIVLPECAYERIDVLIDGAPQIEHLNDSIEVELKGFVPYISWAGGDYIVAARATAISPVVKAAASNK